LALLRRATYGYRWAADGDWWYSETSNQLGAAPTVMYYRRKVLLALIEAFGGRLKRTDCQKLLFLFCQVSGKNHYDFFPYQFGAFSFTAHYDKSRLAELGYLHAEDDFHLCAKQSYLDELHVQDRIVLRSLAVQLRKTRGKELIRKTYQEYPHFACRSRIVNELLKDPEIDQLQDCWNRDTTPCLFTLGYERLTVDAYLNTLVTNNIKVVVDVRNNPHSMKYGFSKKTLSKYVESAGMKYSHIPELGIPSALRKDIKTPSSYRKLFDLYESEIIPKQQAAIERLGAILAEHKRIALTCFEANPLFCHRHIIVDFMRQDKSFRTSVIHL
jgi:uncharacterized protein (DUF488 family)